MQTKKRLIWIFAVLLTIAAGVYQRLTGPTHPQRVKVALAGETYKFKLLRTFDGPAECPIELEIPDTAVHGALEYRLFSQNGPYTKLDMKREGAILSAPLPHQEMAGKLEYKITLSKASEIAALNNGTPTVIRFKGHVPEGILIPHILIMFLAMLFSNVAGLFAAFRIPYLKMTHITLFTIIIGGLIMGPLVQKYAFNEWWAGVPYGFDLTDNKTLIAIVVWVAAYFLSKNQQSRGLVIVASLVTLVIFCIPHSLFGSQLDPATGKIIQGFIQPGLSSLKFLIF
ncbi:MAG: hypothetical protein LWW85_10685 [Marinilabiliales bacterium]|nr:hypothetical protein [Marinilabiliales bacterium]